MGTDIHLVIEEKWSWQKEWTPVDPWEQLKTGEYLAGERFIWRDYSVFRRLVSGVREDMQCPERPVSAPRGLPADVNPITENWMRHNDYHSTSWITSDEFFAAFPWEKDWQKMTHFALVCYSYLYGTGDSGREVRFIFGFDC